VGVEIKLYQRTQTPTALPAHKPPYYLANTRGQQQFGAVIAQTGGDILSKINQIKTGNEIHSFLGQTGTTIEGFRTWLIENPGAGVDEIRQQKEKAINGLNLAGQKLKLPASKDYANNWLAQNKERLNKRLDGEIGTIVGRREAEKAEMMLKSHVANLDKQAAFDLLDRHAGTVYDKELVPTMKELIGAEIDAKKAKAAEKAAVLWLEEKTDQLAAEGGWDEAAKWMNDPKRKREAREKYGITGEQWDKVFEDVRTQYNFKKNLDDEALKKAQEDAKDTIYDAIETGKMPQDFTGDIFDLIESYDGVLTEDQQKAIRKSLAEEENPFLEGDPATYMKYLLKIQKDPKSVEPEDLSDLVGKGRKGGISITQYKELHNIITDEDDIFNTRTVKRAITIINEFAKTPEDKIRYMDDYDKWLREHQSIHKRPPSPQESQDYLFFMFKPTVKDWWYEDWPVEERTKALRALPYKAKMEWMSSERAEEIGTTQWIKEFRKREKPMTDEIGLHYYYLAGGDIKLAEKLAKKDGYIIPEK